MRKKKTLLIVDMQPEFSDPSCEDKIGTVCSLIRMAKKNGWDIINLLYDVEELAFCRWDDADDDDQVPVTQAFDKIHKLVSSYELNETIVKSDCDGGREVVSHLQSRKIASQEIIVCGCYADQCVLETLETIREKLPKTSITVVKKAVKPCYKFPADDYNKLKVKVHTGSYISLTL